MGVPQGRWMVYGWQNPIKMDDDWGSPYDSGNLQLSIELYLLAYWQLLRTMVLKKPLAKIRKTEEISPTLQQWGKRRFEIVVDRHIETRFHLVSERMTGHWHVLRLLKK